MELRSARPPISLFDEEDLVVRLSLKPRPHGRNSGILDLVILNPPERKGLNQKPEEQHWRPLVAEASILSGPETVA